MDKILQDLGTSLDLSSQLASLSLPHILVCMASAALCGVIIYLVYRFFYRGVVYSDNFNILLIMITVITSFIIMTISANLVLSLGMVGALSIVRFRSAIKDPLDIGFLFWGIASGLTCGAGLYFVALVGTVVISLVYIILHFCKKEKKSYLLIVRYSEQAEEQIGVLLSAMKYKLKSKILSDSETELTVEIKIKNNDTSDAARFKTVKGVNGVTLLEYNGEYMN
ncbi:MAG: DUF4956 domain-containing protein [Ruminococcaceae bacterium]|nr:DUF4956 domain-containing protein [Oscillospiraceae bacterium]